ncbi:glycosyltransferase family 2 protein [Aliiroseovarius sp. S1339]|nr:glycosyltransferase family 2 protein [Aliiroseovarius sp. S1339]MCK8463235.1 glycosyltransferase family 2 protein [Aliiroseovarius sp. S1339]
MRLKRRRLIWRSIRSRRDLKVVVDRTDQIEPGMVRAFTTARNEYARLPHFLSHYRKLGVGHFLIVLNNSDDGSEAYLARQPDVSLWRTDASYKASRFGVDWTTWLQFRYGHRAWCLCVDVDELLIYPHCDTRNLQALTERLEQTSATALGALMLDIYPKGPLDQHTHTPDQDPTEVLRWFDASPYRVQRQLPAQNLWVQGGPRDRVFFADRPARAPTLNKLPLVHWNRRFAYMNSTHSLLPPRLNLEWDGPECISGDTRLSGVLLHTKFMPDVVARSREEKMRKEHFGQPDDFNAYYDWLATAPDLWHDRATAYQDWRQLMELGLLSNGGWA